MTVISIIREILKFRTIENLISYAHGPVTFKELRENSIIVQSGDSEYSFDEMGRLFPKGICLLYPEGYKSWSKYREDMVTEYYNSLLRKEDVCLVKADETSEWVLAIYKGRWGENYSAQRGKAPEEFKYCIAYRENEDRLGRISFPEWMLSEEGEE
jgi:hypothetical protein